MSYWLGYFTLLTSETILLIGLFKFAMRPNRPKSKTRSLISNLSLSLLILLFTFMFIEIYFKLFFAQTDAYFFTLAAQNWRERYWQPVNSLGYRDREWSAEDVAGKLKVMVVGDSYRRRGGYRQL